MRLSAKSLLDYVTTLRKEVKPISIQSDFKTVQKKFTDQGIEETAVKQYLEDFKKLRDSRDLGENKDIELWGKKPWDEFKEFVDKTKEEKTKTQEKKLQKIEGAELVFEDEYWFVYKILTYEAAVSYGAGTKWCITQADHWRDYIAQGACFYFLISKVRDASWDLYKIAVKVSDPRLSKSLEYWNAADVKFKPDSSPFQEIYKLAKVSDLKELEKYFSWFQSELPTLEIDWSKPTKVINEEELSRSCDFDLYGVDGSLYIEYSVGNISSSGDKRLTIAYEIDGVDYELKTLHFNEANKLRYYFSAPSFFRRWLDDLDFLKAVNFKLHQKNATRNNIENVLNFLMGANKTSASIKIEADKRTQKNRWQKYAEKEGDNIDDAGYFNFDNFNWSFEANYPLNKFQKRTLENLKKLYLTDKNLNASHGQYTDQWEQKIVLQKEPIAVLVEFQNEVYDIDEGGGILDGNHRIGLFALLKKKTVPAVIGRPKDPAAFYEDWIKPYDGDRKVLADFKTVEKKFKDQDVSAEDIKTYFDRFKKLRDEHRITDTQQKDIDYWGKKPFDDLRHFINQLSQETSKRQTKKNIHKEVQKIKGTKLIAENDQWVVYKVDSYEASEKLGSRNWCIVREQQHWLSYAANYIFYYFISLTLDKEDRYYKIALGVDKEGKETYWDNLDHQTKSVPDLNRPHFKAKFDFSDLSEELQIERVNLNGLCIDFIKDPSREVQLAAVQNTYEALRCIKDPSEEVQLAAIAAHPGASRFIASHPLKILSEKVQLAILERDCSLIEFIKKPCEKAKIKAVEYFGSGAFNYVEPSSSLKKLAQERDEEVVRKNPHLIKFMPNQTEELQLIAVQSSPDSIIMIKKPTKKVQLEAVKRDGRLIDYIKDPSYEVQLEAVKQSGGAIVYIKDPTLELMRIAVEKSPHWINSIKDPPEEIQLLAVKQTPKVIKYITKPSEKVQLAAIDAIKGVEDGVLIATDELLELVEAFGFVYRRSAYPIKMSENVQIALTKKYPGLVTLYVDDKDISEKVKKLSETTRSELEEKREARKWKEKVTSDFKSVQKKFTDKGIDKDTVKKYLDDFKILRDQRDLGENKDIDQWGKKPWNEFKEFVNQLKETKSKSVQKKIKKSEGAELVMEDDDWFIYRIITHEAAQLYGSGTKWCITDANGEHWRKYVREGSCFYFLISKKADSKSTYYKMAAQVDDNDDVILWNAIDQRLGRIDDPRLSNLVYDLPDYDFPQFQPDKGETVDTSELKGLIEKEVEKLDEERRKITPEIEEKMKSRKLGFIINPDSKLKLKLKKLIELCGLSGESPWLKDFPFPFTDIGEIKFLTTKKNWNEIASVAVTENQFDLSESICEAIDKLPPYSLDELALEVPIYKTHYDPSWGISFDYTDRFALILDEDLLDKKIKELENEENKENNKENKAN